MIIYAEISDRLTGKHIPRLAPISPSQKLPPPNHLFSYLKKQKTFAFERYEWCVLLSVATKETALPKAVHGKSSAFDLV